VNVGRSGARSAKSVKLAPERLSGRARKTGGASYARAWVKANEICKSPEQMQQRSKRMDLPRSVGATP